jgi:hypothetical protein
MGMALLFYMQMMFVPHRKHYGLPRPVTEIALLFYMQMMFIHQENTPIGLHGLLGDTYTFLYADDVRTSQKTPVGFHDLLGDTFTFLYADDVRTSQKTHV